jgi:GNAT superfamily N-acetyltransferase
MNHLDLLPGYSVREATVQEFGQFFRENIQHMFPSSVQFDVYAAIPPEVAKAARDRRPLHEVYVLRWFIEYDGKVVGWTVGEEVDMETFYMRNTAILPEHRRKGVYRALLQAVIGHLAPRNYQRVTSRHAATNNAVIIPKLQAGFMITGLEISDQHGTLVNLTYFFQQARIDAIRFRTGEQRLSAELRDRFTL